MTRWLKTLVCALALVVPVAMAQTPQAAPVAKPAAADDLAAPADAKPSETNAERSKSQPGNNAPFWRAVQQSGVNEGVTSLPGAEKGVLIQEFVQYPGSRVTNAGEAWRQVRNGWIIPYGGSLVVIKIGRASCRERV